MSKKTESGDVSGSMGVVLVHQSCSDTVQPGHGVHGSLIRFAYVFLGNDKFDSVPTLRLVKPLVSVDSDLGAKRFSKDKYITNDC